MTRRNESKIFSLEELLSRFQKYRGPDPNPPRPNRPLLVTQTTFCDCKEPQEEVVSKKVEALRSWIKRLTSNSIKTNHLCVNKMEVDNLVIRGNKFHVGFNQRLVVELAVDQTTLRTADGSPFALGVPFVVRGFLFKEGTITSDESTISATVAQPSQEIGAGQSTISRTTRSWPLNTDGSVILAAQSALLGIWYSWGHYIGPLSGSLPNILDNQLVNFTAPGWEGSINTVGTQTLTSTTPWFRTIIAGSGIFEGIRGSTTQVNISSPMGITTNATGGYNFVLAFYPC